MSIRKIVRVLKGGPGPGNFGHSGRPGERGGSSSEGGGGSSKIDPVKLQGKLESVITNALERNVGSKIPAGTHGGVRVKQDGKNIFVSVRDVYTIAQQNVIRTAEKYMKRQGYKMLRSSVPSWNQGELVGSVRMKFTRGK